jgi:acyl-coenzyme A synthetase/AMP-(fatty) acid ligase
MAIPSGSGSEILTRGYFTVTDTTDTKILDGAAANWIYSVLSITVCETVGAAEVFSIWLDPSAAGTDYEIISYQALPGNATFVFNDRLVLQGTDELNFKSFGTCNIDIVINYIAQNWT